MPLLIRHTGYWQDQNAKTPTLLTEDRGPVFEVFSSATRLSDHLGPAVLRPRVTSGLLLSENVPPLIKIAVDTIFQLLESQAF
jgi:hypothetical protein